MATVTKGKTFISGETVEPADLHQLVDSATVTDIVDADVSASAAIALSKLATGALPTGITVASANLVDGTIVNADVSASAAIDGTKISPLVASGTYMPTATRITNIAASPAPDFELAAWSRVGSIVTVSGRFSVGFDAVNEGALRITLPVASNFTATHQAAGTLSISTTTSSRAYGSVFSRESTGLVEMSIYPSQTTFRTLTFIFQYQIV